VLSRFVFGLALRQRQQFAAVRREYFASADDQGERIFVVHTDHQFRMGLGFARGAL
jgi:hypothetical protein